MLPLRWKLYRVMNFLLLISGAILFLSLIHLIVKTSDKEYQVVSSIFSLVFLFTASQAFINLAIMFKTFPDKLLSGAKSRWHVFSMILNVISFSGLIFAFFSLLSEMSRSNSLDRTGLLIMLLMISVLLILLFFIFFCQLSLKQYLKLKNTSLINSMIDSIGQHD